MGSEELVNSNDWETVANEHSEYRFLTGSQVIAPKSVTNSSDYDWVVYSPDVANLIRRFLFIGFKPTSAYTNEKKMNEHFVSLRRDNINLILPTTRLAAERWREATILAAPLRFKNKADRAAFFQLIRFAERETDGAIPTAHPVPTLRQQ